MRQLMWQRGDTIIEVMVAFSVFAMVAIGALTIMNQGTASAQNSLETTLVRQQIDNQAELIRFLHQAYLANPNDATPTGLPSKFRLLVQQAKNAEAAGVTEPTEFGAPCIQAIPGDPAYRFVLDPAGARIASSKVLSANDINSSTPPYSQVTVDPTDSSKYLSYGLWVEPILSDASGTGESQYIDFHIRACWNSATSSPQRTLGTIVRLYVPENVAGGA